jgi:hypothetical protein
MRKINKSRAADQDSSNPDPAFFFQVNPDPIRIQGFDDQKAKTKEKNSAEFFYHLFLLKNCNYLFKSYRRSLQSSKKNIQHFQK